MNPIGRPIMDNSNVPLHVALIMDGNGRWASNQGLPRLDGHRAGVKRIRLVLETLASHGIKYVTIFAFSTENWKRHKKEINFLFGLLHDFLKKKTNELNKNCIKFKVIGNTHSFSKKLSKILSNAEKITKNKS